MPEAGQEKRIGQLAVERGLMTAEQLKEVLVEHTARVEHGSQVPLGELLVELEYISRRQLKALLSAQGGKKSPRQQIPGFELIKKLGEGGMGTTYLARQVSMKRLVAIKVLRRDLSTDKEYVERFHREAQLAGKLSHPNIAQASDVGEVGGLHYLVMEYVEGRSLTSLIPAGGAMEEKLALRLVLQVARALAAGHAHGIIHRDVKPDNVIVTREGVAKLCDFGLAKQSEGEARLTQTGMALGTPHYVSPEQAQGDHDVDIRGDIYSLGATLYHLVTGKTPYDGPGPAAVAVKHITDPVPSASRVNRAVSTGTDRLISKMMAKAPVSRYQTPEELAADIQKVMAGEAIGIQIMPAAAGTGTGGEKEAAAPGKAPAETRTGVAPAKRRDDGTAGTLPLEPIGWRKPKSPVTALIGAAVVTILAIVGYVIFFSGGGKGPSGAGKRLAFDFGEARGYWRDNPEDFDGAEARFRAVAGRAAGTQWEEKVREAIAEIASARIYAAARPLLDRASKLAAAGDYDAAINVLVNPPAGFPAPAVRRLLDAAGGHRAAAEKLLETALTEAEKLAADGDPAAGLSRLEKVAGVNYSPLKVRLVGARDRLETARLAVEQKTSREKAAAARKLLTGILEKMWELAAAGDLRGAAAHVRRTRAGAPADVAALTGEKLAAAGAVAAALTACADHRDRVRAELTGRRVKVALTGGGTISGEVSRVLRGALELKPAGPGGKPRAVPFRDIVPGELRRLLPEYAPTGAAGHAALGLALAGDGDLAGAAAALRSARSHPLAAVFAKKVAAAVRAAEGAAEKAWKSGPLALAASAGSRAAARKLLSALKDFERDYGRSAFARARRDEADRLKLAAWKTLGPQVYTRWPFDAAEARRRQLETSWSTGLPAEKKVDLGRGVSIRLMLVPAGEFLMGCAYSQNEHARRGGKPEDWFERERPRHRVRISKPFYLGKCEVSQEVWRKVVGKDPSFFDEGSLPVESVSWDDCAGFVRKLNRLCGGKPAFRLPTEAEWEYACRAGAASPFAGGETISTQRANYNGSSVFVEGRRGSFRNRTVPVGSLPANSWGLHEMHGNVWEWCADWYGKYSSGVLTDPTGPRSGRLRVVRGGSWYSKMGLCRSAYRGSYPPETRRKTRGLRLAADAGK
jgi:serine/threonine-protein kinase